MKKNEDFLCTAMLEADRHHLETDRNQDTLFPQKWKSSLKIVNKQNIEMKKIFRCIFNTALGIMLVTALVLLLPGLLGIRPYMVYSGSMEPEIQTGAVVFTKIGKISPETGDIITFRNGDTVITHRVIKKQNSTWITKGDANKTADPVPVEESQIIGRVVFCLSYLGYVLYFLKARIPFAAVCVAAGLSVISDLAYTPKKNKKELSGGLNYDEK